MAPLFVAKLTSPSAQSTSSTADLSALYSWAIRPSDNNGSESTQAITSDQTDKDAAANPKPQIQSMGNNSFLIRQAPRTLTREHADDELSFTPSLLKAGDTLAFSFDPQLTQKVAQVYQKKYPSIHDAQSGLNEASLLWISPLGVSNLFLKESKPYVGEENNNDLQSRILAFGKNANAWVQLEKSTLAETANSKSSDEEGKKWLWHALSIHNPR